MARQRTTKFIPLFSHQAAAILSQPLQLAGSERYHLKFNHELEPNPAAVASSSTASKPHCVSCQTSFPTREEQVVHYRLDWHRYNLKRRLKRQPSVSQEEFERIAGKCFLMPSSCDRLFMRPKKLCILFSKGRNANGGLQILLGKLRALMYVYIMQI